MSLPLTSLVRTSLPYRSLTAASGRSLWVRHCGGSSRHASAPKSATMPATCLHRCRLEWPSRLQQEVAVRTVEQYMRRSSDSDRKLLLKVDFANAFNTVDRQTFMTSSRTHIPGISKWVCWCYRNPSRLIFGSHVLESKAGVQQGDNLGRLRFVFASKPLLMQKML